ncbi:MAG: hypothetical protein PHT07_12950 [Paludibacter sp.]|nr:hypothetical protein [Paludibacter sp.]
MGNFKGQFIPIDPSQAELPTPIIPRIKKAIYTMTDLSGKMLLKGQILNGRGKIIVARLSKGTYIF